MIIGSNAHEAEEPDTVGGAKVLHQAMISPAQTGTGLFVASKVELHRPQEARHVTRHALCKWSTPNTVRQMLSFSSPGAAASFQGFMQGDGSRPCVRFHRAIPGLLGNHLIPTSSLAIHEAAFLCTCDVVASHSFVFSFYVDVLPLYSRHK